MDQISFDDLPIEFLLPANVSFSSSFSPFELLSLQDTPAPRSKPKLKPYEQRKAEMISKLHTLPLKTFYTKETLTSWSTARLHKELKLSNVIAKSGEKEKLVEQMYNLNMREGEAGSCSETCGICYLDYEDEEVLRSLDCNHVFHVECIDRWALTSTAKSKPPKCPICNQVI